MRVSQAHRRELLQTLDGMHETTVRDAGTAGCDVLEDTVVPNRFHWVEWWGTEAEAEASLHSDRLVMLLAAARLLGSVEVVRRIHATDADPGRPPRSRPLRSSAKQDGREEKKRE